MNGFTFSKSWFQRPTPPLPSSASSGPFRLFLLKMGMLRLALQNLRELNKEPDKGGCYKSISATERSQPSHVITVIYFSDAFR